MDNSSSENSLFYNTNHRASPVNILNNELSIMSSPRLSSNPFLSPKSSHYNHFLPADFSIFLPNTKSQSHTPSDCSLDEFSDAISTQNRLNQASFILENQQLYNNYTLCLSTLHESIKEVDSLREENDNLRLANIELIHRLSLRSRATIQNCLLTSNHYSSPTIDKLSIGNTGKASPSVSPTSVIEQNKFSFPKIISIPSNGTAYRNKANLSRNITQQRVQDPAFHNQSERACVKKREEEAVELEVYNQGTEKTELCNKWQETGGCPYGGNCQFAHGIAELRPVIRHPRYKTEVCRMVLCGKMCPYGQRCHFRHWLTNEERLLQLQRPC